MSVPSHIPSVPLIYRLSPSHILSVPPPPYILSVLLINCLFTLIYCPSSHLYIFNPFSHTVNPSLVYCLTRPPPHIQNDALRDCPIILLSHFTSIIVNKYVSQCLSVLLPCFSKHEMHISTDARTYTREK